MARAARQKKEGFLIWRLGGSVRKSKDHSSGGGASKYN